MRVFRHCSSGAMVLMALVACGGDKDSVEDTSSPKSPDSGSTPVADSGGPTDTSETGEPTTGTPLTVRMNDDMVEESGLLSVHWLDFEAWSNGEVVAGSAIVETTVDASTMTITMPDPEEAQLRRPSETATHEIAIYALAVRTEDSVGEIWRGISENWLLWSTEDLPNDGVVRGWNFFSPETMAFSAAGTVQLPSNLNPIDVLTFSGVFDEDRATGLRGVMIPLNENSTVDEKVPILDEALSEEWTFALEGRPPENHFYFSDDFEVDCAGELPAAYVDVDGDQVYSPEKDIVSYNACLDDDKVVAYYWEVIRDLGTAVQWAVADWKPGWVLARKDATKGLLLSEQERTELRIGKDCVPENTEPS